VTVGDMADESSYTKVSEKGWSGIVHPDACLHETLRIISNDGMVCTQEGHLQPVQTDSKCSVLISIGDTLARNGYL